MNKSLLYEIGATLGFVLLGLLNWLNRRLLKQTQKRLKASNGKTVTEIIELIAQDVHALKESDRLLVNALSDHYTDTEAHK